MTTTNMMRIMTAIDSRVAKGTPDFKDVMMTPGQPLSFNEPGGFQPSGEPVTEEDIAAFISLACGLKDRANGAITQNDIVGTTKHYLSSIGGQTYIAYSSIGDPAREETASRLRVTALIGGLAPGQLTAIVRRQPRVPYPLERLGLPANLARIIDRRLPGLVLVTGPTSMGKTTTCASMLQHFNASQSGHIVTVEDPIEYVLTSARSRILQRELGVGGLTSYAQAAREMKRQAPNIVMVGEILDRETMDQVLQLASSFLVISTVHGNNAANTISAILNFYPPEQQATIRSNLASYLRAVIAQALVPSTDKLSFVLAYEYLYASPALKTALMPVEGSLVFNPQKVQAIVQNTAASSVIDQSTPLNARLAQLVRENRITQAVASGASYDPEGLERELSRG